MENEPFILDFSNKKKLCDQVLIALRSQILSGQIKAGERLPTVRQLAAQLRINFNTVARAYRILEMEGWITTRQGRGTFVVSKSDQEEGSKQKVRDAVISQMANLIITEAQRLDIPVDTVLQKVSYRLKEKGMLSRRYKDKRTFSSAQKIYRTRHGFISYEIKNQRGSRPRRRSVKAVKI